MCVVLHDVAPATGAACERVLRAIGEVGDLPLTLLAVPRYHCDPPRPEFDAWLGERHRQGDEIALHGYTHQDDGVPHGILDHLRRHHVTRGEGEFSDLSLTEAMRRLTAGVRWFGRLGLDLRGFVAPAWLIGPGTWEALRWFDLSYTCTLTRIVLLPERHSLRSQSLVYSASSPWRRQASLAWTPALAALQRRNPVLRLELHPHDADHAAIRRSWQRLLASHLRDRRATTLADVAERWRRRTECDLLDSAPWSEEGLREFGGDEADRHAERDVARAVQARHHP
jgi:hypothetical protein